MVSFRFKMRVVTILGIITLSIIVFFYLDLDNSVKLRPKDDTFPGNVPRNPSQQTKQYEEVMKKTVVLTSTNSGFLDIAINWLESIKKLGIHPNIILVAEDEEAYNTLLPYNDSTTFIRKGTLAQSTNKNKLVYDTPEYKKLVYRRPRYILDELEKDRNVFFCDVDTVWLQDPFPYFVGDYDIILQRDMFFKKHVAYCAGMVYFRSSNLVNNFVKDWTQQTLKENLKSNKNDQTILNALLLYKSYSSTLKRKVLNSDEFPNGQLFFNDSRIAYRNEAVVVHNNWVIGHDIKVERFKKTELWLVDKLRNN
ncbi:uncharacterized protein [Antedon mediterranea]|uniref:uncharacterized protein n=1 Tax=Antedon mediterranea TaxID=105859 RepID=UPI003AF715FE